LFIRPELSRAAKLRMLGCLVGENIFREYA
jgi:hypothetical protein